MHEEYKDSTLPESYSDIFKSKWYPNFFIKDGFTVFLVRLPIITNFGDDIYLDFSSFIKDISLICNDEDYYLKTYSALREGNDVVYKFSKQLFTNVNSKLEYQDFVNQKTQHNIDLGCLLFGSSCKWAIYHGDHLFEKDCTGNDIEQAFDLLIIQKQYLESFEHLLKSSINRVFYLREKYASTFFDTENINLKIEEVIFEN